MSATRERGEARLVEIEAQRDAEAKGHLERAALWQRKLDAFLEAMHAGRGMDLRAFVTNDPIHKALVAGVEREEANGRDFLARQKAGSAEQSSAEAALLSGRVAALERANAELRSIKGQALIAARDVGAEGYAGSLVQLEKEIRDQRSACAEREEVAAERERHADELVAQERSLFSEALKRIQDEQLSRHRGATQQMVQARARRR